MQAFITICCIFLVSLSAEAQIKTDTVPVNNLFVANTNTEKKVKKHKKPRKGDTVTYYQVLYLKGMDDKHHHMVVFAKSVIENRRSEAYLKIRYMLKREREYLSRIFFTDVTVLESRRTEITPVKYIPELNKKFKDISIWSVLDTDQFFNKTPPY
jgi:hypothetical protein